MNISESYKPSNGEVVFEYSDADSFDNLDPALVKQCYGICFCDGKLLIAKGAFGETYCDG